MKDRTAPTTKNNRKNFPKPNQASTTIPNKKSDKWRVGLYFRELSIVILGVTATFIGSSLISNLHEQKSLKQDLVQ